MKKREGSNRLKLSSTETDTIKKGGMGVQFGFK